ncbi:MAG: 4Fe-4S binding protein [Anaerolineae bacterium]|nr:4Fe-4S binding protein [Anaerolineae bacterium]
MKAQPGGLWDDIIPRIDRDLCRRCADCPPVAACATGALCRPRPDSVPVPDAGFCLGCYTCADACPYKAIIPPRVSDKRQ